MITTYLLSNITGRKKEFAITMTLLIIVGSFFSATFFYVENASSYYLTEKINETQIDAWVNILRLKTDNGYQSIPSRNVTDYINENFNFVEHVVNFTTGFATIYVVGIGLSYERVMVVDENFFKNDYNPLLSEVSPLKLNKSDVLVNRIIKEKHWIIERHFNDIPKEKLAITFYGEDYQSRVEVKNLTFTGFFEFRVAPIISEQYLQNLPLLIISKELFEEVRYNWTMSHENLIVMFDHSKIDKNTWRAYRDIFYDFSSNIINKFQPYLLVDLFIDAIFDEYGRWVSYSNILYYLYGIPIFIVGWAVLKFDFELTSTKRRQELATLKTRGYSNKDLLLLLVLEIIIYTILASLISLPIGNISSIMFLSIEGILISISLQDILLASYLNIYLLIILITVLVTLVLLSLLPTILTALASEVSEARTYTAMGFEKIEITEFEVLILIFYIPGLFVILAPYRLSIFTYPLILLLIPYLILLLHVVIKALGRVSVFVKSKIFGKISMRTHSVSTYIISATLKQRPKSSGYSTAILALVLSFVFITSATYAISMNHAHDIAYYYAGADISFYVPSRYGSDIPQILNETRAINGVLNVSCVRVININVMYSDGKNIFYEYPALILINDSFLNAAYHENYFLDYSIVRTILDSNTPVAIVSENIAQNLYTSTFRRIVYNINGTTKSLDFSVQGSVNYFPRIVESKHDTFMIMKESHFRDVPYTSSENYIFVNIDDSFDPENISRIIAEKFEYKAVDIRVAKTYYENIQNIFQNRVNYGMISMNIAFIIVLLSLGQSILYFDQIERYRKDYAILLATGMDKHQIRDLFIYDTLSNFFSGLLVGAIITLIYIKYLISSPTNLPIISGDIPIDILPVQLVIPIAEWSIYVGLTFAALLSMVYPLLQYVSKLNLSQELKYEFG